MRRAQWLALSALIAACPALVLPRQAESESLPALPGPAPRERAAGYAAAVENARCEGCHEEIAASWRGSMHQLAWSDPVFLSAYVLEPLPFCRSCHAPESDPQSPPTEAARSLGVSCVTCHVQGSEIVGARTIVARGPTGHSVRADPRLRTGEACKACHEFPFPLQKRALMQGTLTEHAASRYADLSCQTCHQRPEQSASGKSFHGHRFQASKDPLLLRSAIVASAKPRSDFSVTITVRAGEVGHAFPTGDMFRRLEARGFVVGDDDKPLEHAPPVVLERVFRSPSGVSGADRVEMRDDRIAASGEAKELSLVFPVSIAGKKVQWEIAYRRMSPAMASAFGVAIEEDEIIVAKGVLSPGKRL